MLIRSKNLNIAIVGINREAVEVLSLLLGIEGARIVRIINPEMEDLRILEKFPFLDIIINVTDDHTVSEVLRQLNLEKVDVISGLSAKILFLSGSRNFSQEKWGREKERERILSSLHEIKQAVLLSKNKEELLKLFLEVAIGSCGADSGSIMLVEPSRRFLKIEMADGLNVDIVRLTEQRFGKGIAGKVARTGRPVLLRGPVDKDGMESDERKDLVSAISCPLVIGSEVVGVLNINSKRRDRIFEDADLAYIEELSSFAADVIKASKEFEVTTSSAFSFSLLGSAQAILDMDYPFEERLNLLLMKIANSSGCAICNYYKFDSQKKIFLVKASSSFNMSLLQGKKMRLNDHVTAEILRNQKTICLQIPESTSSLLKWYIAHPIKLHKRLVGLLFLHLVSPKKEMNEEQKVVARIGDLIVHELNKNAEMEFLKIQSVKLSAVSEASYNIAAAKDVGELVNFVLPYACLVLEAEAGVFRLLNPVTNRLEIFKAFSIDEQGSRIDTIKEIDSLIHRRAIPAGDVLLIEDIRADGIIAGGNCPQSFLGKTFVSGESVAGAISLYGKKSLDLFGSRSFTKQDKEVFMKFCLQVSKALARLMPYFDEQRTGDMQEG